MSTSGKKILEQFSARKIILPVLIGLGVLVYVFVKNFDKEAFAQIPWSWMSLVWLFLAIAMMGVRQFFYMWRIRYLTDYKLSWQSSLQVILLWEFSSAATPTAVGGTAVALFLLAKENISAGKSIALVLCTIFLDMIFLMSALVLALIIFGFEAIFPICDAKTFSIGRPVFIVTFILMFFYTILVAYGIFINPGGLKWLLVKLTAWGPFKRWQHQAEETGNQLVTASSELVHHGFKFWMNTFLMTIGTWTGRFFVVICLVLMVADLDDLPLFFFRQLALMVMLMMSPTPGGSGVAEYSFDEFVCDMIPYGLVSPVTALWRIFTYYPYLFLGLLILPKWVKRVFK